MVCALEPLTCYLYQPSPSCLDEVNSHPPDPATFGVGSDLTDLGLADETEKVRGETSNL